MWCLTRVDYIVTTNLVASPMFLSILHMSFGSTLDATVPLEKMLEVATHKPIH